MKKQNVKHLDEFTKKELMVLYMQALIETKKVITPEMKQKLLDLGFKLITVGTKEEHEINSKELKKNFFGYDIAIGVAASAISYGCRRKYYAYVINLNEETIEE